MKKKGYKMSLLIGVIFGAIIAAILPNPLMWLEEKYQERKGRKLCKKRFDELVSIGISEKTASEITGHER